MMKDQNQSLMRMSIPQCHCFLFECKYHFQKELNESG